MQALDFIVIGAQKAGTTTLWHMLRDHPQLALPTSKEAPYFSDDLRYKLGLQSYMDSFFPGRGSGVRYGTVTPQYMAGSSKVASAEVASRIALTLPHVKLIALMRDPLERAVSHHRMSARRGMETRLLERALREQLTPGALAGARLESTETNGYIVWGEYGRILSEFREYFAPAQFLLILTTELQSDPDATLGRILRFIDVDDEWRPSDINVRRMEGGDESHLSPDEMRGLVELLHATRPDIPKGVFAVPLEEWNTLPGCAKERLSTDLESRLRAHFSADAEKLEASCNFRVPWAGVANSSAVPPSESPDVSIIVLIHDTVEEAEIVLESIVRHTTGRYEILVVDNGSSPKASDKLAAVAIRVGARYLRMNENLVFSVAMNAAVRASRGQDILLLNSDVVVTENWLSNMRSALHSAPDIAAVGPRSNYMRMKQGGIWLDDNTLDGIERFGHFFNYSDPDRWFEIDWISGFALLVRRDIFDALGGLDENVPWYGLEDKDFSERLWGAGFRVLCAGDTFIYHTGHRTFAKTGTNRTATRLGRMAAHTADATADEPRLLSDEQGLVFEVRGGVASHLETVDVVALLRAGRPIETAAAGELEALPVGPPVVVCRVRGNDQIWVLNGNFRNRVTGDLERMRRIKGMCVVDPADLATLAEGPPVLVEDAVPPVPEIKPLLLVNPARIAPELLATTDAIVAEIAAALTDGRGFALIRLDVDEATLLNNGMWPVGELDRPRVGVRGDLGEAAVALRRAIIEADAVGVATAPAVAPLLEQLLFHFDLYPRLRCSADIGHALLGLDASTGSPIERSPLMQLLKNRPVAIVCPAAMADLLRTGHSKLAATADLNLNVAVGLDDMSEVDDAFLSLAARRDAFDAVLVSAEIPAKALCARLARELQVVALDIGHPLDRLLHPGYNGATASLAAMRWEVSDYLRQLEAPQLEPVHELDGRVVREAAGHELFYVERGHARLISEESLLSLLDQEPMEIEPERLATLPRGATLCLVHERLTGPYVLMDGKKRPVQLGLPVVEADELALAELAEDDRVVDWRPRN